MNSQGFQRPAPNRPRLFGPMLIGVTAVSIFFGGFAAWAVVAPISSAANAPGRVRVESYRKTIQHLEGGIIREILVSEGEVVEAGQLLVRLDDVQADSMSALVAGQVQSLRAQVARLVAERDGRDAIAFPQDILDQKDDLSIGAIIDGQTQIFESRKTSLDGQMELLAKKISALRSEIEAYQAQQNAAERQMAMLTDELDGVRDLAKRGFETRSRMLSLERELAKVEGDRGEQLGLAARAEQSIGEAELQMVDLRNQRAAEIAAELRDAQTKLAELQDRLRAASDVRDRTDILAPQDGRIVSIRNVTPGGVVRPGEPIMDLVPVDDEMVIEAQISPLDIDTVHPGLAAEVKLTSYKQQRLPILIGEVVSVSADALTEERTGADYYLAEIQFTPKQLEILEDVRLYPGMPAEVLVVTGERTPFEYLAQPVRDSFRRALRED